MNENVARIVAFFVIVVALAGIFLKSPLVIAALAFDFYLRAFTTGKYSPLKYISKRLANYFGTSEKLADAAPKKFAAGMGLIFTLSIAGLLWLNYNLLADSLMVILLICAALESFKGYCVGCIVYTYLFLPLLKKEDSERSTISINL